MPRAAEQGYERSSVGAGMERNKMMTQKRFNALLSMLLCAAMLLSMVAMLSGCTRSGKNDSPALQHKILHYYSEKDSTSYFFVDGKNLKIASEAASAPSFRLTAHPQP